MATLAQPTAQRADVTVWLQALDGTWEACGTDRMIGVVPESLECVSDGWGSKTASFDLRRPVMALWPDIAAFAPCMIEIGCVLCWRGRTGETPIRDGADPVINVQCEGSQVRLDDDVYQRAYVHSTLSDYKDMRSVPSASLGANKLCAAGQVTTDSAITIALPSGYAAVNGTTVGVVLDLGPNCTAAAMSIDYETSAGATTTTHVFCVRTGPTQDVFGGGGSDAWVDYPYSLGASGTISNNFPTPNRYVHLFVTFNSSYTLPADLWIKLKRVQIFTNTAYRSGSASALTADIPINDALARATTLLSPDRSGIQRPSFTIDDLAPDEERTPREIAEGVNAYHDWILKLDAQDRPIFKPRPTQPLLEIGAWQGAELVDASANSGAEIYNRCITRGVASDGTPVVVTRWDQTLAQTPALALVQPPNPSFDTDTANWGVTQGTLSRTTTAGEFVTGPGGGKTGSEAITDIATAVTGLDPGRLYELRFYTASPVGETTADINVVIRPIVDGDIVSQTWSSSSATFVLRRLRFTAGQAGGVVIDLKKTRTSVGVSTILLLDEFRLYTGSSSLVDRRGFRKTFVLKPSFKITPAGGQKLADVFVASHRTTPYRGSCRISPGGARYVLGGSSPHPSALLTMTQELLCLSHRIDPDTGGVGRTATIDTVTYTHRDEAAAVSLDDPRGNFDALMARMAEVQGAGA